MKTETVRAANNLVNLSVDSESFSVAFRDSFDRDVFTLVLREWMAPKTLTPAQLAEVRQEMLSNQLQLMTKENE